MALKIIFMGTPEFAVPILKAINDSNHKILEVYTQPAKRKNRGQKINQSKIHINANELNLTVRSPDSLSTNEELEHLKKLKPDLVVVVAYGKILPESILNLDKVLFINLHASLLPKWRGAAPIQRSLMNLDNETGVSIMKIVPRLDAGPVMMRKKIKIMQNQNYKDLSEKLSKLGAKLILNAIKLIEGDKADFVEQNEAEATYAKKILKSESKINWNDEAIKVLAKINALNPNPGCWFELNGFRIKIIKATKKDLEGDPGKILDKELTIACKKGAIQILELKREGKNTVTTKEFLRGNEIIVGQYLN